MLPVLKLNAREASAMFAPLSAEESGLVYKAMLRYMLTGEEPEFDGVVALVWNVQKAGIDEQSRKYHRMCERNQKNVTKRYDSLPLVTTRNDSLPLVDLENEKEKQEEVPVPQEERKEKDKEKENRESKDSQKKSRNVFRPPTVKEVAAYCAERGNDVDPQLFVDFYTGKDWMVGKNRMKDWRAAVRTWERSRGGSTGTRNKALLYKQTPIKQDDFDALVVDLNEDYF